jgi:hypothetical protein
MARYNQLSPYRTVIGADDAGQYVQYHQTRIVVWNDATVTLNSGGWQGVTTKRKMNQASHQFGLGYSVSQKAFAWSVTLPDGSTVDFQDGMTFARHPYAGLGFAPATLAADLAMNLDAAPAISPEATEYNRDLALRVRNGQVGSGLKLRGA